MDGPEMDGEATRDMAAAEVGIVGAGFAGLAGALTLRRHRHSVVVFDGGSTRNAYAAEVHGYLGVHGASGKELRRRAWDQVVQVGGQIFEARIVEARRDDEAFILRSEDGRRWRVKRLLLATGVRDVYPDIDNFYEFWGKTVHICPHCDGYEVRDKPVAVVSWGEATKGFTLKLKEWTNQITVVTDGRAPAISPEDRAELADQDIGVITQTVRQFEGDDGQLTALRFQDGSTLPVAAAFFNIKVEFQIDLAEQLGCALTEGNCIQKDANMRTTVENVWAAGDVTGEEQLVAVATSQGVKAGVDIFRSLADHA